MSICDFLDFATDDNAEIEIFDLAKGIIVFKGEISKCLESDYANFEICSFDSFINKNTLCLNIDSMKYR